MNRQCKQCNKDFPVTDEDLAFYTVFGRNENLFHKKVRDGE